MEIIECLKKQAELRQKEAKEKQITWKVRCITDRNGLGKEEYYSKPGYTEYVFKNRNFTITFRLWDEPRNNLHKKFTECQVKFRGKIVFQSDEDNSEIIDTFVPGGWEKEFEKLYNLANSKQKENWKKQSEKMKQDEEKKLRERFGL